jgi:hypothetical protein
MSEHMTINQLASVLGVTRTTIYNRQASGELPTGHPEAIALWHAEKLEKEAAKVRELVKVFTTNGHDTT